MPALKEHSPRHCPFFILKEDRLFQFIPFYSIISYSVPWQTFAMTHAIEPALFLKQISPLMKSTRYVYLSQQKTVADHIGSLAHSTNVAGPQFREVDNDLFLEAVKQ